jgi:hypothetical protein
MEPRHEAEVGLQAGGLAVIFQRRTALHVDLLANLTIPDIASPQLALVEPRRELCRGSGKRSPKSRP